MNSDDKVVQVLIADGVVDFQFRFFLVEAIQHKAVLLFFKELAHHSLFVPSAFAAVLVVNHSLSHYFFFIILEIIGRVLRIILLSSPSNRLSCFASHFSRLIAIEATIRL